MEINQYTISHKELLELIIKKAGVHEGKWMLMVSFGFSAGNFGPSDSEISPGVVVAIQKLGISRADANSPAALVLDAAVVNPASGGEE